MPAVHPTVDVERERVALNIIVSAGMLIGPDDALKLLNRELRAAPEQLMGTPVHQSIYTAARDMTLAGRLPNLGDLTMRPELRDVPAQVWAEIEAAEAGSNLSEHLEQLTKTGARRRARQALTRAEMALETADDPLPVINKLRHELASSAVGRRIIRGVRDFATPLQLARAKVEGQMKGLPTGIPALDAQIGGGILPGKVMLFGALSGTGKSRFAFVVMAACLLAGHRVMTLSGEMKSFPIVDKDTGETVQSHEIINGVEGVLAAIPRINAGATISDGTARTLAAVRQFTDGVNAVHVYDEDMSLASVIDMIWTAQREGIDLVVIDNLTHVNNATTLSGNDNDTHNKPRKIVDAIATAAGDAGVAVLILFQPSINKDISGGKAPDEHELGESRGIIHSAYYTITAGRDLETIRTKAAEMAKTGNHWTTAEINVIKVRGNGGKKGSIAALWNDRLGVWCSNSQRNGPTLNVDDYLAAHPLPTDAPLPEVDPTLYDVGYTDVDDQEASA